MRCLRGSVEERAAKFVCACTIKRDAITRQMRAKRRGFVVITRMLRFNAGWHGVIETSLDDQNTRQTKYWTKFKGELAMN